MKYTAALKQTHEDSHDESQSIKLLRRDEQLRLVSKLIQFVSQMLETNADVQSNN